MSYEANAELTPEEVDIQAVPITPHPTSKVSSKDAKPALAELGAESETQPTVSAAGDGSLLSDDLHEEAALEREVATLWEKYKSKTAILGRTKNNLKQSKEDVALLQVELDRVLYDYKQQLAKAGRNGRWTPFLRGQDLSRATADRWAKRHQLRVNPVIGPHEAFCGSTEKDITKLVKKIAPGLIRRLPTPTSVAQFLREITAVLRPSDSTA